MHCCFCCCCVIIEDNNTKTRIVHSFAADIETGIADHHVKTNKQQQIGMLPTFVLPPIECGHSNIKINWMDGHPICDYGFKVGQLYYYVVM